MLETIVTELIPATLSVLAVIISMVKGKSKTNKTAEEIENIAEAKKQKLVAKLNKKNNIKPIENIMVKNVETVNEIVKPNWQQAFGVKAEKETETQGE